MALRASASAALSSIVRPVMSEIRIGVAQTLQASQEMLRQQQEELQQTNEELEEKAQLLQEQNREVEKKTAE